MVESLVPKFSGSEFVGKDSTDGRSRKRPWSYYEDQSEAPYESWRSSGRRAPSVSLTKTSDDWSWRGSKKWKGEDWSSWSYKKTEWRQDWSSWGSNDYYHNYGTGQWSSYTSCSTMNWTEQAEETSGGASSSAGAPYVTVDQVTIYVIDNVPIVSIGKGTDFESNAAPLLQSAMQDHVKAQVHNDPQNRVFLCTVHQTNKFGSIGLHDFIILDTETDNGRRWAFEAMSLRIDVSLLSGEAVQIHVDPAEKLYQVRQKAQTYFQLGIESLLTPSGETLHDLSSVEEANLKEGDALTAVCRRGQLFSGPEALAFAFRRADGTVMTWGHEALGGNSKRVKDQLVDVKQIVCNNFAFAALRSDGRIVTWGEASRGGAGGIPGSLSAELQCIVQVVASTTDFAALRSDGRVVCWGSTKDHGAQSLLDTAQLVANSGAFAALSKDGQVECWGVQASGGRIPEEIQEQLVDIQRLHAGKHSFVAVRKDGKAFVWGDFKMDEDISPSMAEDFRDIQAVASTGSAMALLRTDGRVLVLRATRAEDEDTKDLQEQLEDVVKIQATFGAFCALRKNGTVVTWGSTKRGGDSHGVQLQDIQDIASTNDAFAATRVDGTVVTWGDPRNGGNSFEVQEQLRHIQQVKGSYAAFAALREDDAESLYENCDQHPEARRLAKEARKRQIVSSLREIAFVRPRGREVPLAAGLQGKRSLMLALVFALCSQDKSCFDRCDTLLRSYALNQPFKRLMEESGLSE
eukprot:symbB.v1.2.034781.t1/scaffold4552.1/size38125/1